MRMRTLTSLAVILFILSACGGTPFWLPKAHKIDIQQGNLLSPEALDKLQLGMPRETVRALLGDPVLGNSFNADRWDYAYSLAKAGEQVPAKTLSLFFENGQLARIENEYEYSAKKHNQDTDTLSTEEKISPLEKITAE